MKLKPSKSLKIKRDSSKTANVILLLLACFCLGFGGGWLGADARRDGLHSPSQAQEVVLSESELISDIVDEVGPSVVSIDVTSSQPTTDFFGFTAEMETASAGTGIIISEDGYVMTNRHVVSGETESLSVTLSDGTILNDVTLVGRTSANDSLDIAFLKINDTEGKKLTPAKIGDSSKVQVGDRVVAIGNALGRFQNTVTAGIISGFGRDVAAGGSSSIENLQNLFQTDTAINEGNSGGPLVNIKGEVIGVNTAIAGQAQNIGFAIPIDDTKGLIKSVLEKGKLERVYLGIRYITLTDEYAYQYNLEAKRGAYIAPGSARSPSILKDSPAEKAGLKEKDIITKINDVEINENNSLASLIGQKTVGEEVTLTVIRGGEEITVKVKLEATPAS